MADEKIGKPPKSMKNKAKEAMPQVPRGGAQKVPITTAMPTPQTSDSEPLCEPKKAKVEQVAQSSEQFHAGLKEVLAESLPSKKPFLPDLTKEKKAKVQDGVQEMREVLLMPEGATGEAQEILEVWETPSGDTYFKRPKRSLEGAINGRVNRSAYDNMPNGHWEFEARMRMNKAIGFVYLIQDLNTGKSYIGKKFYETKGKKAGESNWKWYIASCKALSESIQINRKEGFRFICLEEYQFKGSVGFAETWSICYVQALANPDFWYNRLINKVSWVVKEGITERHKRRLDIILRGGELEEIPLKVT